MDRWNSGLTLFFSLLVEAFPFLLLGVTFSSVLLFFIDERRLIQLIPKHPMLGALIGSMIGFLFPVCECGNVPVARRLLVQGAPTSTAIGFLLAAPTVNPIVFWATWTAFRDQPEIVFMRIGFSLFIATIVGWVFSSQKDVRPLLNPAVARAMPKVERRSPAEATSPLLQSGTFLIGQPGKTYQLDGSLLQSVAIGENPVLSKSWRDRLRLVMENIILELRELGGILILGTAIASLVQVAIPRDLVLSLGQGPISSIVVMMFLAWIVSICSTVDAFFALSFASTFTTGSLLAFLVFGPMIDLKNLALLTSVFRTRAIAYLFILAGQLAFLLALLVNLYWG
ncbi:permease [Leptolyngbya sp. AN02str]|uniref:permease n=1 Tax=Leptolyngbya sp. AN02str TaxID=3423363 RepID=UPI003D3222E6